MQRFEQLSKNYHRQLYLFWFLFLFSTFVYATVLLLSHPVTTSLPTPSTLMAILAIISCATIPLSFVIPGLIFRPIITKIRNPNLATEEFSRNIAALSSATTGISNPLSSDETKKLYAYQNYFVPFIIQIALCESIAIYGFVLGFTTGTILIYVPFFLVSFILFLVHRPNLNKIVDQNLYA